MNNAFRRRLVFIVLASAGIWIFLWYTHSLVDELARLDKRNCETIARLWAGVQYPLSILSDGSRLNSCTVCGTPSGISVPYLDSLSKYCPVCGDTTLFVPTERALPEEREDVVNFTRRLFADLVSRLDFNTIFSDMNGYPQIVNGEVTDGYSRERIDSLFREIEALKQQNEPVPLMMVSDTIGYLYYGDTRLSRQMKIVPLLELGLLFLIAAVIYFLLRAEINREKDLSWVGFARETAHQLSTPLSSLMGWIELLRDEAENDTATLEALNHMSVDVTRLTQIADRYGQMGRKPRMKPFRICDVISEIVSYFNRRKGLLGHGVVLESSCSNSASVVSGNPVLLGWVLENLIKNAVAACASVPEGGKVIIQCNDFDEDKIEILVRDNGCGISYSDQGCIFNAGYTTRKGGWGLGLSLSRRIVEQHHQGSIRLVSSSPGQGSIFCVSLPKSYGGADDNDSLGG